jgi:hypothetical protein
MSTDQSKGSCLYRFRLNGIRAAKTILSSVIDVVGDWTYYYSVLRLGNDALVKYYLYLWIFCAVSTSLGAMLIASLYCNFFHSPIIQQSKRTKFGPFGQCVKTTLGLQMFIEDIPQFILTLLITRDTGLLSPHAVFNFTTTGVNFLFNILNMIEIEDDGSDDDDNKNSYTYMDNAEKGRSSRGSNAVPNQSRKPMGGVRKSTKDVTVHDEVFRR